MKRDLYIKNNDTIVNTIPTTYERAERHSPLEALCLCCSSSAAAIHLPPSLRSVPQVSQARSLAPSLALSEVSFRCKPWHRPFVCWPAEPLLAWLSRLVR